MSWPQSDQRLNFDGMPGHESHLPLLSESGDQKNSFHPRKLLANANASAAAEWEV